MLCVVHIIGVVHRAVCFMVWWMGLNEQDTAWMAWSDCVCVCVVWARVVGSYTCLVFLIE
jgi:hypothetical protein